VAITSAPAARGAYLGTTIVGCPIYIANSYDGRTHPLLGAPLYFWPVPGVLTTAMSGVKTREQTRIISAVAKDICCRQF
jgi:hypothetical protein